jgi:hypothetical protein
MKPSNFLAALVQAISITQAQDTIGPLNQRNSHSQPTDPRSGLGFLAQGCGTGWSIRDGILEAQCDDQVCGNRVTTQLDLRNWFRPSLPTNPDGNEPLSLTNSSPAS